MTVLRADRLWFVKRTSRACEVQCSHRWSAVLSSDAVWLLWKCEGFAGSGARG
jgi:hypothetical protein